MRYGFVFRDKSPSLINEIIEMGIFRDFGHISKI